MKYGKVSAEFSVKRRNSKIGNMDEVDLLSSISIQGNINPSYIRYAQEKYKRNFVVQDVCTFEASASERFDFILLNSLLHHLSDDDTHRILGQLAKLVSPGGFVHIVDLVLPARRGIPRWLAESDRGDFPRPLSAWEGIFTTHFRTSVFEPFPIKLFGIDLWNLVYFKGEPKE